MKRKYERGFSWSFFFIVMFLALIFIYATTCMAFGQTPPMPVNGTPVLPAVPIDPSLQPFITLLGPKFGHWVIVISAWSGAIRLVVFHFAQQLQDWTSHKLAWDTDEVGSDHDQFTQAILRSKAYRVFAYLLALATGAKLPSIDTYIKHLVLQQTPNPKSVPSPDKAVAPKQ